VDTGRPPHALLLAGPPQVGKTTLADDLAAGLLCTAEDPAARPCRSCAACRKVAHGNHADLHRLVPEGAGDQIRLAQVQALIGDLALIAMEGRFRVAIVEQAHRLNQDAQNALLKTLEEPAPFAHLILICSEPELLAETILSRCAPVEFGPLAPDAVLEALGAGEEAAAAARLSGGDVELARLLLGERGTALRATAEAAARAARSPDPPPEPWRGLLDAASEAGQEAGAEEERRLVEEAEATARRGRKGKLTREATEQVKRTERRARTQTLDLGLALCCDWYRDLAAVASGADDVVLNADRREQLAEDAEGLDPANARSAVEWVLDTRRRLRVNVSEELALEALWLRLADALSG